MATWSIKNLEFHLVLQSTTNFLLNWIFNRAHVPINFSFILGITVQKLALSLTFSMTLAIMDKPSFTIKFNICAQHRMWNSWPPKIRDLLEILSKMRSIIASFVVQLSTVKVETFLSRFQSIKHSTNNSARTWLVWGTGTYINLYLKDKFN